MENFDPLPSPAAIDAGVARLSARAVRESEARAIPPAEQGVSRARDLMGSSASASGEAMDETERMMKELGLKEDDLQDVVVEDGDIPAEAARWMAVARVHTPKSYSQFWFYRNMRVAWDLAQEVKFRPLEDNLYTLQFSCLGDWERVMEDGPWAFKGKTVVIEPYDGYTRPSSLKLDKIEIWIQIHDLPDLFFHLIKSLASTVGEFIYAEQKSHDFEGNFYRVRVKIDVTKPLKNAVSLVIKKKREIFIVKYERLPDWCAVCGMLGHLHKECGDGVHAPSALVFKNLRADWFRGAGMGPGVGKGRGNGGNRGGGRSGRSSGRGQAREQEEWNGHDLGKNTSDATMTEVEANRKRGAAQAADLVSHLPGSSPPTLEGNNQLALISPGVPQSPSSKQEPKRNKTATVLSEKGKDKNKTNDARLAGSPAGSRLAQ